MYLSPEFYKFSELSLELAEFASRNIDLNYVEHGVDLFAGQGVVGLEFLQKTGVEIEKFSFIEKEIDFMPFLRKNIESSGRKEKIDVENRCVFNHGLNSEFDLILLNPPFYESHTGRHPYDSRRKNCHFMNGFSLNDIFELLSSISKKKVNVFMSFHQEIDLKENYHFEVKHVEKEKNKFLFKIASKEKA